MRMLRSVRLWIVVSTLALSVWIVMILRKSNFTAYEWRKANNWKISDALHTLDSVRQDVSEGETTAKPKNNQMAGATAHSCSQCPTRKCSDQIKAPTGNRLIDCYGQNDLRAQGEMGRGLVFTDQEQKDIKSLTDVYGLNVKASDSIPLNRLIPDSRPKSCANLSYPEDLPSLAVILPFHNEWPSLLLRSVYSVINRTPQHLLKEIILVDDASTLPKLKNWLDQYIKKNFPPNLVKVVRLKTRGGLIRGRLAGFRASTADVVSFQDSHIEVMTRWAEPLLQEIKKDPRTIAMSQLDYINKDSFMYQYHDGYRTRYLITWDMQFFEDYWRPDQLVGKTDSDPLPGVIMCGSGFAIDAKYFREVGMYDEGMDIWGGENIEMGIRVWMCGGRLVHVPCSHVGHVPRGQPYTFPGGREKVTAKNYLRVAEVWMGDYKKYLLEAMPVVKTVQTGNVTDRLQLKERLECKSFEWYIKNINPELALLDKDVYAWAEIKNTGSSKCLSTKGHLFQYDGPITPDDCHGWFTNEFFSWTKEGYLRSSLHCVAVKPTGDVTLSSCINAKPQIWSHVMGSYLKHADSGRCLAVSEGGTKFIMVTCNSSAPNQQWTFGRYKPAYDELMKKAAKSPFLSRLNENVSPKDFETTRSPPPLEKGKIPTKAPALGVNVNAAGKV